MTGREVARLARDRGIAVLLVTGQCPADASEIAVACLGKPHSASALVAALKALETMVCKHPGPRKVRRITTFWRQQTAQGGSLETRARWRDESHSGSTLGVRGR